jgi:carbon storage regulator CsrA
MALVLTRKIGESVAIGPHIVVQVAQVREDGKVRLRIHAPRDVLIGRTEIRDHYPVLGQCPLERAEKEGGGR